jgi:hypothetical protein
MIIWIVGNTWVSGVRGDEFVVNHRMGMPTRTGRTSINQVKRSFVSIADPGSTRSTNPKYLKIAHFDSRMVLRIRGKASIGSLSMP